jgi:hypothetical protein
MKYQIHYTYIDSSRLTARVVNAHDVDIVEADNEGEAVKKLSRRYLPEDKLKVFEVNEIAVA